MPSGLVLIDKPIGFTSHDVVAKLRGIAGTRRVGHAGTLDPMATGLLLIGINSATKLLTFLVGENKTYLATIRLGASTITDDKESEFLTVANAADVSALTDDQVENAISQLRGEIMQVPSSVSAIKVDGQRAYAKVRGGDEVKLAARPITIHKFEILSAPTRVTEGGNSFIDVEVVVDCSSGTYIRALARDLGEVLGVGGHLTALRRTKVGSYNIEQAQSLEGLTRETLQVLPIEQAAKQQFEVRKLSAQEVIDIRHGKKLAVENEGDQPVAALDDSGNLIAMLTKQGISVKSLVVFAEGNDA
ncbi:tRNA pseudouridine(55) synthase TruB [Rhodoluna sp.]|uniref:tRNA pseudouridine(55) synthase TruB n=1 Tax=Rhodoluna sp. TaxID=1969481 RepID=UPI0025EE6DB7|nr:tRNA pseudouridine(55) synthase TruB [Rhodoluna sp.]